MSTRRKTTTRSFRVDKLALEEIEKDAAKAHVSVNTLVNQLLLSHANSGNYFSGFQTVTIPSDAFAYMIQCMSDGCAVEVGRRAAGSIAKSVILAKHGSISLDAILDHLKTVGEYSKFYAYSESDKGGRKVFTLIHSFGPKGSIYFTEYVKTLFKMIELNPKITSTEKAVNASL